MTPMTVMAQNVERHPSCWPSSVPNGTPRTLAMVRPREHHRDGAGALVGRDHVGGNHRADSEERTVAQRRDDASAHHDLVGGSERGHQVADDEQHHEREKDLLALEAGDGSGQEDRADRHRQCVARDQVARDGLGDLEISRDLGQEAHDDKFGEADPEPAHSEGNETQWHLDVPFTDLRVSR